MFVVTSLIVILLFVNGAFEIMKNQLINLFSFDDALERLSALFTSIADKFEGFFFTSEKIHIISLTFTAIVLVSVFFACVFIIMKILSFFLGKKTFYSSNSPSNEQIHEEPENSSFEDESFEEIEENSVFAPSSKDSDASQEQEKFDQTKEVFVANNEDSYVDDYKTTSSRASKPSLVELDWQKSNSLNKFNLTTSNFSSSPITLRKDVHDLLGMIVNMLGRHIDELKISQATMFRCKNSLSEETILQLVLSVKEFLILCQQGAFNNVRHLRDLPDEEESIVRLIAGDTSYAMALLEALMDEKINQAVNMKNIAQRNMLFKTSSNYACYFGTLAEMNDMNLASASFELAVEMCPENTLAWSRCADLYKITGQDEKALWAYHNVLKIAHRDIDSSHEANARKVLSESLYDQGESIQASELYLQSKNYYDSIGINRPLDRKELEIIELIDNTSTENIVRSILPRRQNHL